MADHVVIKFSPSLTMQSRVCKV